MTTSDRQKRRTFTYAIVGFLIGVLVVLQVRSTAQNSEVLDAIRSSQQDRAPIIDSTHQSAQSSERALHLIESCLIPGRPCSRRSAKNQSAILRQVLDGSIYVAICARDPRVVTVAGLRACALRQAAADARP